MLLKMTSIYNILESGGGENDVLIRPPYFHYTQPLCISISTQVYPTERSAYLRGLQTWQVWHTGGTCASSLSERPMAASALSYVGPRPLGSSRTYEGDFMRHIVNMIHQTTCQRKDQGEEKDLRREKDAKGKEH